MNYYAMVNFNHYCGFLFSTVKFMDTIENLYNSVDCDETNWTQWEAWGSCECWGGAIQCGRTYKKRIRICQGTTKECSCKGNMVDKKLDCNIS